jgi:hypothetical protein
MFSKLSREFEFYSGALDYMRRVYFGPENQDPYRSFAAQLSRIRH